MSQPDFTRLPFFLLPTLPLTFSPCIVGSYSPTLLSSAPGMPSHLFLLLNPPSYLHPSSLYLYLCLFLLSLPGDLCQVQLCVCVSVCACDGKKHATQPCHDQHSSMPVNDTSRHPTVHITMVAGLSAGWISGRTSHFGSAPNVGLQWRWHQRLWMTPLWQPLPPTLCHYYRFSQCMPQDREMEMED